MKALTALAAKNRFSELIDIRRLMQVQRPARDMAVDAVTGGIPPSLRFSRHSDMIS
jgi:hypothetical protein